MQTLLRQLAELPPVDTPVLSIYLDMRPHTTGGRPALRESVLMMEDRLREIEKTYLPRGADLDSFRADVARIEDYLRHNFAVSSQGLVIFACAASGLFETLESGVPFEHQVTVGSVPDLFQLARLADDQETAVVGIADTNTVRLFVMRTGFLEEREGLDEDTKHFSKTRLGGLNMAQYQRHIEKHRNDFAQEAAAEIELLVAREGASRVVLVGNQTALPLLLAALPQHIKDKLHGGTQGLDLQATRDVVEREVGAVLARAEAEEELSIVEQLIAAVRSSGLGVAGLEHTRASLEHGQVDVLILGPDGEATDETRNQLIRLAATTGADVSVVERQPIFEQMGSVGALLRYRHDTLEKSATMGVAPEYPGP